jgi:hypothetical protein
MSIRKDASPVYHGFLSWEAACDRCGTLEESPYIHIPGQQDDYRMDFLTHLAVLGWDACRLADGRAGHACPRCAARIAPVAPPGA